MPIDPKIVKASYGRSVHIGPSLYTPWGRFDLYLDYGWKLMRATNKRKYHVSFFTTRNPDVTKPRSY